MGNHRYGQVLVAAANSKQQKQRKAGASVYMSRPARDRERAKDDGGKIHTRRYTHIDTHAHSGRERERKKETDGDRSIY